jgi:hypothetical protein
MNQYKLSDNDQKQIAHYIAQRSIANVTPGEPIKATNEYLNVFNQTLEILKNYNETVTDL